MYENSNKISSTQTCISFTFPPLGFLSVATSSNIINNIMGTRNVITAIQITSSFIFCFSPEECLFGKGAGIRRGCSLPVFPGKTPHLHQWKKALPRQSEETQRCKTSSFKHFLCHCIYHIVFDIVAPLKQL